MSRNGRTAGAPPGPVTIPGAVPIIGAGRWVACARGHVERVPGPFTMTIPSGDPTVPALAVELCRICWLNFVGLFSARELTAEELEQLRAAEAAEAEQPAGA